MKHSVKEVKLKNGAQGLLVHVPDALVFDFEAAFNAGFYFSSNDKYELPHLMEHLMFTNKTYKDKTRFSVEVEKNGAYKNAYTDSYHLTYDYQSAAIEAVRILKLFAIQVSEPLFRVDEIPSEKGNVVQELSQNLSNNERLNGVNLYSNRIGIPSLEQRISQLETMTRHDIVHNYQATHLGANMRFILAADLSKQESTYLNILEGINLPKGKRLQIPKKPILPLEKPLLIQRDVPQIYYRFSSALNATLTSRERIAANLINRILSDGYQSRVYSEARRKGWAYHLWSSVYRSLHDSEFHLGGFATPDHIAQVLELWIKEVRDVLDGNVSNRELAAVKLLAQGRFARGYQTSRDLLGWYDDYFTFNEFDDFQSYPEVIKDISKDEAIQAFRRLFTETNWGVSFTGAIAEPTALQLHKSLSAIWKT